MKVTISMTIAVFQAYKARQKWRVEFCSVFTVRVFISAQFHYVLICTSLTMITRCIVKAQSNLVSLQITKI